MKKQSDIGRRLQQVRYERDYTVEYVANQTGISANVIYHYENYGGVPGSEYLGKICKVLGISENGTLGSLLTSRVVLAAVCGELGLNY